MKIQCPSCHKTLAIKDELAGRRVRCTCGATFVVPDPNAARAGKPAAGSAQANNTSGTNCPFCTNSLPGDAVLCVSCGYNLKTGQRLQTTIEQGHEGAEAGSSFVQTLIASLDIKAIIPILVILVAVVFICLKSGRSVGDLIEFLPIIVIAVLIHSLSFFISGKLLKLNPSIIAIILVATCVSITAPLDIVLGDFWAAVARTVIFAVTATMLLGADLFEIFIMIVVDNLVWILLAAFVLFGISSSMG